MTPSAFYNTDSWLKPYTETIDKRIERSLAKEKQLTGNGTLSDFAMGHHYYGLHKTKDSWIFREWAPNAKNIFITGIFTGWKEKEAFRMKKINANGDWELTLPADSLNHGDLFKLSVTWEGGKGERIPAYSKRVVQDEKTKIFSAQVWEPSVIYKWKAKDFIPETTAPVIYEAHIGMATSEEKNRDLP